MSTPAPEARLPRPVALALLFVVALRLVHMRYALQGPLTWQPGADENYYTHFGRDVAFGSGGLTELFAFMDPLYGYIVGAVLRLGAGLFPLYVLQILVDCASAYGLYRIGARLDRPRAGLIAMLAYGATGTAIAYTMAVLKETFVVAFVVGWTLAALRVVERPCPRRWLALGLLCGAGVALRANFLLLVPLGLLLLGWLARSVERRRATGIAAFVVGITLPLALLTARNLAISGKPSPMPNNGGIVMHQLYNADNPLSRSGVPRFVGRYSAPEGIWSAYRAEAERRTGRRMRPQEVSAFWGKEARAYMLAHPAQSVRNAVRKLREASAYPEVPNNRNYVDERRVSPLLAALPLPFGWWFALGLPGLALLAMRDRRGWLVIAPALTSLATLAVFFAEDRFRFHLVPALVIGAGVWIDALASAARGRDARRVALGLALPALLGAWTVTQARLLIPQFPSDWPRLAWGYIKSGQRPRAEAVLDEAARNAHDDPALHEIRGYLATVDQRWPDAAREYAQALQVREDRHEVWHNFSLALEHIGQVQDALAAEDEALARAPGEGPYLLRRGDLLARLGRNGEARAAWQAAAAAARSPPSAPEVQARLGR